MSPAAFYPVIFEPYGRRAVVPAGASLLEAACRAGIELVSGCGGGGDCGQCRVLVLDGRLSPVTDEEKQNLSAGEIAAGQRLACHTRVLGPGRVCIFTMPPTGAPCLEINIQDSALISSD